MPILSKLIQKYMETCGIAWRLTQMQTRAPNNENITINMKKAARHHCQAVLAEEILKGGNTKGEHLLLFTLL